MTRKKSRIILDTNLLISFLINKDFQDLDKLLVSDEIILVFSQELLEELVTVLLRPKFRKIFSKKDLQDLLEILDKFSVFIEIVSDVNICRDPKDNFLLNLAIDGKADFLLTGDNDLLSLIKVGETEILTLRSFLNNRATPNPIL
jgi:hypothetical protein